jgi:hypothetical protein
MPMFVDPNERVPVTLGENTVYIRARMSVAVQARVQDELAVREGSPEAGLSGIGSYTLALLVHNIVGWEGPDFVDAAGKPVPCTRANIERLDPDTELLQMVRDEIGARNARRTVPESEALPN